MLGGTLCIARTSLWGTGVFTLGSYLHSFILFTVLSFSKLASRKELFVPFGLVSFIGLFSEGNKKSCTHTECIVLKYVCLLRQFWPSFQTEQMYINIFVTVMSLATSNPSLWAKDQHAHIIQSNIYLAGNHLGRKMFYFSDIKEIFCIIEWHTMSRTKVRNTSLINDLCWNIVRKSSKKEEEFVSPRIYFHKC